MASWQDFAAPVGDAAAPAAAPAADWTSLAVPAPMPEQSLTAPKMSAAEKDYQDAAQDGGFLGRVHSALGGFTDQAARALTFGLSDKAAALAPATAHEVARGVNALYRAVGAEHPFPEAENENFADIYHQALEQERNAGTRYSEDHPIASKVATTLGTVASVPITTAAAPIAAAPTVLGRTGQAALAGGTIGGIAGFGQSNDESLGKDALATGTGVAIGAPLGAATSLVADKVIAPIADWVARKFSPDALQNQAVKAIATRIGQNAGSGGPTAQDMLDLTNAAASSGKPMMLADLGGEGVQGMAERIANTPGPGRQTLVQALSSRDAGAGTRLAGDVGGALGSSGSNFETAQALTEARAAAARPAYEAAGIPSDPALYAQAPTVDTPAVARLIDKSKDVRSAIAQAKSLPDYADLPDNSMVLLDKAYKNIGGQANAAKVSGNGEGARDLNSLRTQLLDAITGGDANHPYKLALDAYSGPSASLSALNDGAAFAGKSPQQIAAEVAKLSPSDQEFYRLGAANALKTGIAKTSSGGDEARKIVGNDYVQQQIRALSPSDTAAQKLIDAATAENTMFQTKTNVLGNSRTALRQAEQAAGGEGGLAGAAGQTIAGAVTGEPVVSSLGAFNLAKRLYGALARPNSEVDQTIAKLLTSPDPAQNQRVLAQIMAQTGQPSRTVAGVVPLAGLTAQAYPSLTRLPFIPGGSGSP